MKYIIEVICIKEKWNHLQVVQMIHLGKRKKNHHHYLVQLLVLQIFMVIQFQVMNLKEDIFQAEKEDMKCHLHKSDKHQVLVLEQMKQQVMDFMIIIELNHYQLIPYVAHVVQNYHILNLLLWV